MSALLAVAPAGGRRARCWCCWRLERVPPAGAGAVRGARRRPAARRPVPGQHGLQPGDPDRATPAQPETGAIRYLAAQRAEPLRRARRAGSRSSRCRPTWRCATASTTRAATTTRSRSATTRLWRRSVAPGVPDFTQPIVLATGRPPAALRALSLLSVTDVLQDPDGRRRPRRPACESPTAARRARLPQPGALPRVFLVGAPATGRRRGRGAGRRHDARPSTAAPRGGHRAAGRRAFPDAGDAPAAPGTRAARLATRPSGSTADARAPRERSLLVLTDVHFPGWKATVDGRTAPIERVDYLLRGVVVPPGAHRVEFTYEPTSFRAGWIISLLAALAVLAGWSPSCCGDAGRGRPRPEPAG